MAQGFRTPGPDVPVRFDRGGAGRSTAEQVGSIAPLQGGPGAPDGWRLTSSAARSPSST
jgi:hypothetical protein